MALGQVRVWLIVPFSYSCSLLLAQTFTCTACKVASARRTRADGSTAVRAGDIPKIGPILLELPDFDTIQVHGWKVSRKFVEVLSSV